MTKYSNNWRVDDRRNRKLFGEVNEFFSHLTFIFFDRKKASLFVLQKVGLKKRSIAMF